MKNHSISIIDPLDECPAYSTVLDTKVTYKYGGVNIIENKLSVGYVFKLDKTMED